MSATHAEELKATYLLAFDAHSTDPMLVAESLDINTRFARELLGTLVKADLLVETDANGDAVWQVFRPENEVDRDEAVATIDEWLGMFEVAEPPAATPNRKDRKMTNTPPAMKTNGDNGKFHACLCGCKQNVPAKSHYKPGHDARHAGRIGREIADNYATKGFDRRTLLNTLPSDRLKAKAEAIAENRIAKAEAKAVAEVKSEDKPKPVRRTTVKRTAKKSK